MTPLAAIKRALLPLLAVLALAGMAAAAEPAGGVFAADAVLDNMLLTSYWTASESVCVEAKEPVYANDGALLGWYRADFRRAVQLEGWGIADGDGNGGNYLGHYRPRGFYCHWSPLDNRGGALIPWQTAAANNLPRGTRIRVLALPEELPRDPLVRQRLLTTTFIVHDRGSGLADTQLDLYVGGQTQADMHAAPESLYIPGSCLAVDYPI
ncbi:MAG TPA: hypothetical protein PKM88_00880 [bacterium]|nr:hypothetical protein [bacterium]